MLDEPPIVVYEQEGVGPDPDRPSRAGRWRAQRSWPLLEARQRTLSLGGGGRLQPEPGAVTGWDELRHNATVGTRGGLWSAGLPFGLPGDQRLDEALSLVYTSEPLTEDVHILGRPSATLHVSTTASVIGFAVSLCDIGPDGRSELVVKGILNGTRRASLTDPEALVPDEQYALTIELDATAWRVAAGHRIRVAVANADWPNVWPTPEPATSRVWHGRERPSSLMLPVVPSRGTPSRWHSWPLRRPPSPGLTPRTRRCGGSSGTA